MATNRKNIMKPDMKCLLGLHAYEVYKEFDITNYYGVPQEKVVISRCANCGKIRITRIDMTSGYDE